MSSMNTARIAALVLWCASPFTQAQTACNNLTDFCGQVDSTVTLSSTMDLDNVAALNGLFAATSVQVIRFHTTYLDPAGQGLEVHLSNSQCAPFFQARVFQPDPFNPCDAGAYVSVSDLMTTNEDTVMYTAPLYINTDYILLVGSNTAGCALDVRLEGRSVSIDACCAAAIDYGETVNVEIKGSDPALGFVWTPARHLEPLRNDHLRSDGVCGRVLVHGCGACGRGVAH